MNSSRRLTVLTQDIPRKVQVYWHCQKLFLQKRRTTVIDLTDGETNDSVQGHEEQNTANIVCVENISVQSAYM